MGKSEVVPLPIHRQESLYAACNIALKMSVNTVEEEPGEEEENYHGIPEDMEMFANQVAGHNSNGSSYGLMRHNGTVLKPITKPKYGDREMEFYDNVNHSEDKLICELREFIPKHYGKRTVPVKGKNIDCIVLEDLTKDFKEPCVMDIKIGRRTWDPEASFDKIRKEEGKYVDCKRDMAFCIPGFQVYNIYTNQLRKFDKEYGKNLNKESVVQALRTFLNADNGRPFCRSLLVQFLAVLWQIQQFVRIQRRYHFFSSSILLVYDARRLRDILKTDEDRPKMKLQRSTSLYRPLSLAVLNHNEADRIPTGFSGQLTNQGPILKTPRSSIKIKQFADIVNGYHKIRRAGEGGWQKSIRSLKRTHSFQNNYDKDMQSKKQDYTFILDELCTDQRPELWATAKMIDFAHAFPPERYDIDRNYLEGVDNLIKIFEDFLIDSE